MRSVLALPSELTRAAPPAVNDTQLTASAAFPEAWACAIGPDTRANRLLLKETIGPRLAGLGVT